MAEVVLVRHGETEWSVAGRHTSFTDLDLTPHGEQQARALGRVLSGYRFGTVLCSPTRRALRTAELAGLVVTAVDEDLREWNYGDYEGLTTIEIRRRRPDWSLWTDGAPGGESPGQVGLRIDRLLARVRALLDDDDVALVGHGHALRVVAARWVGLAAREGALLRLDTATLSALGFEHAREVVRRWNMPADATL